MTPASAAGLAALLIALPAAGQEPRTVVDSLGRAVPAPARADRILSLQPELSRILIALGAGDRLVGVDYFLRRFDHAARIVFPRALELPLVTRLGEDVNVELVLELEPDIVFVSPSESWLADALQAKLPAPVAAFSSLGSLDGLFREVEFIGDLIGRRERADEIVRFARAEIEDVRGRWAGIPPSARPRAYLSFYSSLLRTNASYEPVDAAGGVNVAGGLPAVAPGTRQATVALERILAWDPDLILIQGNYPPAERAVTVDSVLGDARLRSLRAVRGRKVAYTFGFWHWWDPAQVLLETRYLARVFHPGLFRDFDFEAEGDRIYRFVYGKDGVFSAVSAVLKCDEWLHDQD
jgi:iron complex transport system substrate-binding protein